MVVTDTENFETIFFHLAGNSSFKYNNTKNGVMIDGTMFGLEWKAGYDSEVFIGTYSVVTKHKIGRNSAKSCKVLK